jgi:hypothetical protein
MMLFMPPRRHRNLVLQRYQVEIRGNSYFVICTRRHALVGGPYKSRIKAQERADELERRMAHG